MREVKGDTVVYKAWLPALTLLMAVAASAAEPPPLPSPPSRPVQPATLAELENMALANNPTLVQAAARVRQARGEYVQAGLYPNPVVGYLGQELGQEGTAGQQGAYLSQEIVTRGKLQLGRAAASHEIQQAQQAWEIQRYRILTDVRIGYYEVLAAQTAAALNRQLVDISQEAVTATQRLLATKEGAKTDLLQARVEYHTAKVQLQNSQNRAVGAWRQLAAVVGAPNLPPATVAGSIEDGLPDVAWEAARMRLLSESPELARARAAVAQARCELTRQLAEVTPNLQLQTSLQHDNATNCTITGIQAGVAVPLFNRNQGNITKAQGRLIEAERNVQRIELLLENRLATAFERYANARQQVEQYKTELMPTAKEAMELVGKAYQQGESDYLKLLTAQRTCFRVNLTYLESLRELRVSTATIDGLLLSGGLEIDPDQAAPSATERPGSIPSSSSSSQGQ